MTLAASLVMRGLDPRIHRKKSASFKSMDCRVKPGNDAGGMSAESQASTMVGRIRLANLGFRYAQSGLVAGTIRFESLLSSVMPAPSSALATHQAQA